MSRLVHVNLLREEERRGHSPIRARVMVPMFSGLALLAAAVWAGLALLSNAMLRSGNARAEESPPAGFSFSCCHFFLFTRFLIW